MPGKRTDQARVAALEPVIDIVEARDRTSCVAPAAPGGGSHSAHCVGFKVAALMALSSAVAAITSANCA